MASIRQQATNNILTSERIRRGVRASAAGLWRNGEPRRLTAGASDVGGDNRSADTGHPTEIVAGAPTLRLESPRRSRPDAGRPDEVSLEMMILGMALGILMLALARSLS